MLLVTSEMLGLFVNTLNDDEGFSLRNSEKFLEQIQIQLS